MKRSRRERNSEANPAVSSPTKRAANPKAHQLFVLRPLAQGGNDPDMTFLEDAAAKELKVLATVIFSLSATDTNSFPEVSVIQEAEQKAGFIQKTLWDERLLKTPAVRTFVGSMDLDQISGFTKALRAVPTFVNTVLPVPSLNALKKYVVLSLNDFIFTVKVIGLQEPQLQMIPEIFPTLLGKTIHVESDHTHNVLVQCIGMETLRHADAELSKYRLKAVVPVSMNASNKILIVKADKNSIDQAVTALKGLTVKANGRPMSPKDKEALILFKQNMVSKMTGKMFGCKMVLLGALATKMFKKINLMGQYDVMNVTFKKVASTVDKVTRTVEMVEAEDDE